MTFKQTLKTLTFSFENGELTVSRDGTKLDKTDLTALGIDVDHTVWQDGTVSFWVTSLKDDVSASKDSLDQIGWNFRRGGDF